MLNDNVKISNIDISNINNDIMNIAYWLWPIANYCLLPTINIAYGLLLVAHVLVDPWNLPGKSEESNAVLDGYFQNLQA